MDMVFGWSKAMIEKKKICRDWVWVLGLSKPIIQPTQLDFGLSLAGVWQLAISLGHI